MTILRLTIVWVSEWVSYAICIYYASKCVCVYLLTFAVNVSRVRLCLNECLHTYEHNTCMQVCVRVFLLWYIVPHVRGREVRTEYYGETFMCFFHFCLGFCFYFTFTPIQMGNHTIFSCLHYIWRVPSIFFRTCVCVCVYCVHSVHSQYIANLSYFFFHSHFCEICTHLMAMSWVMYDNFIVAELSCALLAAHIFFLSTLGIRCILLILMLV